MGSQFTCRCKHQKRGCCPPSSLITTTDTRPTVLKVHILTEPPHKDNTELNENILIPGLKTKTGSCRQGPGFEVTGSSGFRGRAPPTTFTLPETWPRNLFFQVRSCSRRGSPQLPGSRPRSCECRCPGRERDTAGSESSPRWIMLRMCLSFTPTDLPRKGPHGLHLSLKYASSEELPLTSRAESRRFPAHTPTTVLTTHTQRLALLLHQNLCSRSCRCIRDPRPVQTVSKGFLEALVPACLLHRVVGVKENVLKISCNGKGL